MGLRESKQTRQRGQIIENAVALFRERGFEATRVREIAAACEISDATFFNYFPNKDAVIAEWAEGRVDAALEAALHEVGDHSLRRPVRELARRLAREIDADEAFMREAWLRARIVPPGDRAGVHRCRGLAPPSIAATEAFRRAQARGELRSDAPAEQFAEMLRSTLVSTLAVWLARRDGIAEGESLEVRLGRCADLLLDGFRKRNERVRADSIRSGQSSPLAPH